MPTAANSSDERGRLRGARWYAMCLPLALMVACAAPPVAQDDRPGDLPLWREAAMMPDPPAHPSGAAQPNVEDAVAVGGTLASVGSAK